MAMKQEHVRAVSSYSDFYIAAMLICSGCGGNNCVFAVQVRKPKKCRPRSSNSHICVYVCFYYGVFSKADFVSFIQ